MRRYLPFLLLLFFLSCSHQQQEEKSKRFLPKDKMIHVLLDIHLSDAMMVHDGTMKSEEQMKKVSVEYEKIFNKHEVTSQEFYSTFNYYLNHPAEMDSVYKDLVEVAIQKQSEMIKNLQSNRDKDSTASSTNKTVRKNLWRERKKK